MFKQRKYAILCFVLLLCSNAIAQDLSKVGKGKAIKLSGSLGVGTMLTSTQGIEDRRSPYSWYINGSPTIKLYNITIPFSFVWSEQERSFSQPFNKYGVSPYYKWIKIHAGYRNIYYSDYTLAGATFLGGGFDLKPGRFRLGAVYGKFQNKTKLKNESKTRYSYLLPSYERWGFGAKIGYGKGPNTTDLILFRATDKLDTSIMRLADSAYVKPMENISIGLKSKYTILKKLDFNLDMAISLVTLDSRYVDTITGAPELELLGKFITLNRSSVPYLAGKASLGYAFKKARLKVEYKRVDPEYQTLGSYYVNNDIEQYTVSSNVNMFKNKLILNGSYGIRTNNLLGDQYATSINKIGSFFLTYNPKSSYGISLNYSNYGTDLSSGEKQLNDSIIFSIVNQSLGGNIRFTKTRADISHNLILNAQYQELLDNNVITRNFTESKSYTANVSYNYGRGKKGFSTGGGVNYSNINTFISNFQLIGPSFHLRKKLKKQKLNLGLTSSYQLKLNNNKQDGTITNIGGNIGYSPHKKHSFYVSINALFNTTPNKSIYSFNEQRLSIRYNYQL